MDRIQTAPWMLTPNRGLEQALAAAESNEEFYKSATQAYQAWLGFYNSHLRKLGWSKPQLVEWANAQAFYLGLVSGPPALQARTVGKMGLKGTPGLNVEKGPSGGGGGGRGGGGRGRGGRR